ncbi:Panacea domain-containing protein [Gemmiger formicilis]|jgi:uncharacterized phage-associated protein|uniref:Panacea domain-containing protein n=1 Tax=Gemmiger formicilis TaxID=745368 RepID=UPI003CCB498F
MVYKALDVARYIINHEATEGRTVSNLRLQKLLYFVQCAFLGVLGHACFNDIIEAWDYGPVVPDVYRKYKVYGGTMIPADSVSKQKFDADEKNLVDLMLDTCAAKQTGELVNITHMQAPWRDAYVPGMNNLISQDAIRQYVQE